MPWALRPSNGNRHASCFTRDDGSRPHSSEPGLALTRHHSMTLLLPLYRLWSKNSFIPKHSKICQGDKTGSGGRVSRINLQLEKMGQRRKALSFPTWSVERWRGRVDSCPPSIGVGPLPARELEGRGQTSALPPPPPAPSCTRQDPLRRKLQGNDQKQKQNNSQNQFMTLAKSQHRPLTHRNLPHFHTSVTNMNKPKLKMRCWAPGGQSVQHLPTQPQVHSPWRSLLSGASASPSPSAPHPRSCSLSDK